MAERTTVLVTGVAGYWGSRVAARLAADPAYRVIGLDTQWPERTVDGLDVVQTDLRTPGVADLLATEAVQTVCHLAFVDTARPRQAAFDLNVGGTRKLLEACTEVGVRKVVIRSSMAVYGAHPGNQAFITEDEPRQGRQDSGSVRDLCQIEAICNGFRTQSPNLIVTLLRFAGIVGPTVDTPMTRFLLQPWAPSLIGFDPMMQVIHEEDVVGALVHAVARDLPGAVNVAAEGVLPLNKVRGLAGKAPFVLPSLGARVVGGGLRAELDIIRCRCVGDLARMRESGFAPRYTAEEALRELAERQPLRRLMLGSELRARGERRLRDIVEQRQRHKARSEEPHPSGKVGEGEAVHND